MRYFIEVTYNGLAYSGFQIQENAHTIQGEVEKALQTFYRVPVPLTGSSRTDAQVHALQNWFHADMDIVPQQRHIYNLNALLPPDIAIRSIRAVRPEAHCRFHAASRSYEYRIYQEKQPFLRNRAFYYPYPLNLEVLQQAAGMVPEQRDFLHYSKTNSQVKTHICEIHESAWRLENGLYIYHVKGSRFLRGMVRALTGTMLRVGRGRQSLEAFRQTFTHAAPGAVDFSPPGFGLYLTAVEFPAEIFLK